MRPPVLPLDLVDHQDAAAVDLVLLALTGAVHVNRVINDPLVAGLVLDDAIVPRRKPALALEEHEAVRDALRLLERLERTHGALRPSDHDAIFGIRPAAIVAGIEEIEEAIVVDHPRCFDEAWEAAVLAIGPNEVDRFAARRE